MKPTVFSYTRLSTFDQCQHRYAERYLKKYIPKYEGIEAFVGIRVHEVVEAVEIGRLESNLPAMWLAFDRNWQREYHSGIIDVRRYGHDYWWEHGNKCVRTYYDHALVPEGWELVGVELKLGLPLLEKPMASFVGKLDRVIRNLATGEYFIQDFKTGKMPKKHYFNQDMQLPIYAHLFQRNKPVQSNLDLKCQRIYLAHDAKIHEKMATPEERKQAWWWVTHTAMEALILEDEMRTKNRVPEAQRQPLCDWCPYKKGERCPVWALSHPVAKVIL